MVGESGAPVSGTEIPVLERAFETFREEMSEGAVQAVDEHGLIEKNGSRFELRCVNGAECVFVDYDREGNAHCIIQRGYHRGEFSWEKPLSCHLYPIRLKRIGELEYAMFEYIPDLCSAGCRRGTDEGIYLSDFLKDAFIRRYGEEWFDEFSRRCDEIRNRQGGADAKTEPAA